jgi:hypothetical protein
MQSLRPGGGQRAAPVTAGPPAVTYAQWQKCDKDGVVSLTFAATISFVRLSMRASSRLLAGSATGG